MLRVLRQRSIGTHGSVLRGWRSFGRKSCGVISMGSREDVCWNIGGRRSLCARRKKGSNSSGSVLEKLEPLKMDSYIGFSFTKEERQLLNSYLVGYLERNWDSLEQELGVELTAKACNLFRKDILNIDSRILRRVGNLTVESLKDMITKPVSTSTDRLLYLGIVRHARMFFRKDFDAVVQKLYAADFRQPHQFYLGARERKRKVIYHQGPTNSGKTYSAMMALKACSAGVYAGPLRLLALESFERLNRAGVFTNLRTGQECREVPFATHESCTVEMFDVDQEYDVVVIDEIQMINESDRGHAWTRALLGANAGEIHLCGDPTATELVKHLCHLCEDEFIIKKYERRTPLKPMDESLKGDIAAVKGGDAIIAFNRNELFRLKHEVETLTDKKCCVIYGNLPPETRARQARLFNDPTSGFDVLVATDAIGMGLNLNIGRIIFSAVEKIQNGGGTKKAKLTPPQIRQIAGRAGRDGTLFSDGMATCLHSEDMDYFRSALDKTPESIERAGMLPSAEQLIDFAGARAENIPFSILLDKFSAVAKLEEKYALCDQKIQDYKLVADLIEDERNMTMFDRFNFVTTPLQVSNEILVQEFQRYVREFSTQGYVHLYKDGKKPAAMSGFGFTTTTLHRAESHCQLLDTYIYLANLIGVNAFIECDLALAIRHQVVREIDVLLQEARYVPKKQVERQESASKVAAPEKKLKVTSTLEQRLVQAL